MCGRFENTVTAFELYKRLHELIEERVFPQAEFSMINIAPTMQVQTLIKKDGKIYVTSSNWGIKFDKNSPLIINSRIETIKEKSYWKEQFEKNRSLIPMSAFYEWRKIGKVKQPFRVSLEGDELFFVPAITIKIQGSSEYFTSVITTSPNNFMKDIHHRMPVILTLKQVKQYFEMPVDMLIQECNPLDDSVSMRMIPADI